MSDPRPTLAPSWALFKRICSCHLSFCHPATIYQGHPLPVLHSLSHTISASTSGLHSVSRRNIPSSSHLIPNSAPPFPSLALLHPANSCSSSIPQPKGHLLQEASLLFSLTSPCHSYLTTPIIYVVCVRQITAFMPEDHVLSTAGTCPALVEQMSLG